MHNKTIMALMLLVWLGGPTVRAQKALSVSDIHFNPFYDSTLVDTLVKTPVEGWSGIFESSSIQTPNGYGSDANYPLVRSAMAAMQQADSLPRFIIITGDFLCHDFQSTYVHYAGAYADSLPSFTTKTIQFLADLFDKTFPHVEVLPTLGNNDSYCGDYDVSTNNAFLRMFAQAWVPLQRNKSASADSAFVAAFSRGGYYEHNFNSGKGSLLVLNTVFFSAKYANNCGGESGGDPVRDELLWVTSRLRSHMVTKTPVWMAYHIAPGIDVHSSWRSVASDCASKTIGMWKDSVNSLLLSIMKRYAATIRIGIAGHTHADDFRVIYHHSVPATAIFITPAISPLFGNNPGFKVLAYNGATMGLLNSEVHYLALDHQATAWTRGYDFRQAYNITGGINAETLSQVRMRIAGDSVYRSRYIQYYTVSNPASKEITAENWMAFWCGTGNLSKKEFAACYCQIVP